MSKRKRRAKQASMWVATQDLPRSAAHPFYTRLNQILDKHDFDFFGFDETNPITLSGPAPFTLNSLLVGPSTISSTPTISMTLLGTLSAGGTLTATFAGVSTATLETLNWANLTSVRFSATNDSALDNIVINQVPEPASLALLGAAALTVGARRFRRK